MNSSKGILYLLTGHKSALQLIVSLVSLREHYSGPVTILSLDPKRQIDRQIAEDSWLDVEVLKFHFPDAYKRNGSYLAKTNMHRWTPFDQTLFLDADTTIEKELPDHLWARGAEIVLTQFSRWTTHTKRIEKRVKAWNVVATDLVTRAIAEAHPAVNTGVFSWSVDLNEQMAEWHELTKLRVKFICDEIAMQLIYQSWRYRMFSDLFNHSPIYGSHVKNPDKVFIWHYHGGKHLRAEAQPFWNPWFERAKSINAAGICDLLGK